MQNTPPPLHYCSGFHCAHFSIERGMRSNRRRLPSVSGDDCCIRVSQFWSLHLLVWLCRPMREWQSLPHRRQVWNVAAWSMEQDLLRAALFSFRWSVRSCLACLVPQCTAALQESLDSARLSHDWMSIDALFRSLLQVSLKRSLGRPLDLAPLESSPYSKSLGMRPSAIRRTWPNQRRRRWLRIMKMDGTPCTLKHDRVLDLVLPSYAEYAP